MKNLDSMVDEMQTELLNNIHRLRAMADAYEIAYEKLSLIRVADYANGTGIATKPQEQFVPSANDDINSPFKFDKYEAPVREANPVGKLKEKPKRDTNTPTIAHLVRNQMDIYYQGQQEFTMGELIEIAKKGNGTANYNNVVNAYTMYYKSRDWEPMTYKNEHNQMVYKLVPAIKN